MRAIIPIASCAALLALTTPPALADQPAVGWRAEAVPGRYGALQNVWRCYGPAVVCARPVDPAMDACERSPGAVITLDPPSCRTRGQR